MIFRDTESKDEEIIPYDTSPSELRLFKQYKIILIGYVIGYINQISSDIYIYTHKTY